MSIFYSHALLRCHHLYDSWTRNVTFFRCMAGTSNPINAGCPSKVVQAWKYASVSSMRPSLSTIYHCGPAALYNFQQVPSMRMRSLDLASRQPCASIGHHFVEKNGGFREQLPLVPHGGLIIRLKVDTLQMTKFCTESNDTSLTNALRTSYDKT